MFDSINTEKRKAKKSSSLHHVLFQAAILWYAIALVLEWLFPGLVSYYIDFTTLFAVVVVLAIVDFFGTSRE